jgi:hypothetical protein
MLDGAQPITDDNDVYWIVLDEIKAINERREALHRAPLDEPNNGRALEAVGLALSGGGIRSAAVSLGVLQAFNFYNVLRKVDYLSTVSGGGYMGCSLTATLSVSEGGFVYGNVGQIGAAAPPAGDISDTDAVGHIRNYSNYLIPSGLRDVVTGLAIIVRGLVANFGLVLPVMLVLATLTIWWKPKRSDLSEPSFFGLSLEKILPTDRFGLTLALFLIGLVLFFAWAIYRSFLAPNSQSEYRENLPTLAAGFLIVVVVALFCEIQPFVIAGMFGMLDQTTPQEALFALVTSWIKSLAAITAPISAVVMFFRQQLGDFLKSTSDGIVASLSGQAVKLLVWVAGLALPLCIWVGYLYLCFWGIANDGGGAAAAAAKSCPPGSISATIKIDDQSFNYQGDVRGTSQGCGACACAAPSKQQSDGGQFAHTPPWIRTSADRLTAGLDRTLNSATLGFARLLTGWATGKPVAFLYLCVGILLSLLSYLLKPNANSLHRLYRDRLSKAFLFNPNERTSRQHTSQTVSAHLGGDFVPLDTMLLGELSSKLAPYHLINAALNIQGSDYANRRGRNADFFLFSKKWIGSIATGYAPIEDFQRNSPDLDLATAMAISGAAASSNMGADTIKPLTPTLALLNVRLGYWLRNPAFWAPTGAPMSYREQLSARNSWIPRHWLKFYLWAEITGRLYENSDLVYLTDGGHIENLGIYELLRRKCRVIVAVDAEADRNMNFPSLVTLQRYARIDLGIRINLPWLSIQKTTTDWMMPPKGRNPSLQPTSGPHVAVGTIEYGAGERGFLVYIKSSLSGDENDYIRDYARRNPSFPHESTGDQFFSEEQFEVYRALGFHMASQFLSGDDPAQTASGAVRLNNPADQSITIVRDRLTA